MNTVPQNGKDVSSPRKDMPQPHQSFFQGISQRIAMAPFWALGNFAELGGPSLERFFFFFQIVFFLEECNFIHAQYQSLHMVTYFVGLVVP